MIGVVGRVARGIGNGLEDRAMAEVEFDIGSQGQAGGGIEAGWDEHATASGGVGLINGLLNGLGIISLGRVGGRMVIGNAVVHGADKVERS